MATTRKFGIISNTSGFTGGIMINSISTTASCETAEARDEQGAITDIAGYSQNKTVNIQGVLDTAKGSLAQAGSVITVDSKSWLVESVQKDESNTAFVSVSIQARTADNAEIYIVSAGNGGNGGN